MIYEFDLDRVVTCDQILAAYEANYSSVPIRLQADNTTMGSVSVFNRNDGTTHVSFEFYDAEELPNSDHTSHLLKADPLPGQNDLGLMLSNI